MTANLCGMPTNLKGTVHVVQMRLNVCELIGDFVNKLVQVFLIGFLLNFEIEAVRMRLY
jgi:hypothetical protein